VIEEKFMHGSGGKLEGKRTFERPRHGGENNIKIYPKKMGWSGFVRPRVVTTEHGNEPSDSLKCGLFRY
jgi:hypothetical protein